MSNSKNSKKSKHNVWTVEEVETLYELKQKGLSWPAIAKKIKKSSESARHKYKRTQWSDFHKDPAGYISKISSASVSPWSHEEMIQLDAFLRAGKSYEFIADEINRTIISVEKQAQRTDWNAWSSIKDIEEDEVKEDEEILLQRLLDALLTVGRYDRKRLMAVKEDHFLKRINLDKDKCFISFADLQEKALERLEEEGFGNREEMDLGEGTYVIVGDSHGKHTQKDMFSLLRHVNNHIKPDKIIHIGHMLDDDDDISYEWGGFDNLIVIAKIEELKALQSNRNKFNLHYDLVRECVNLGGDLAVLNQDLIQDYVATPITNIKTDIVGKKTIVNCHRHEMFSRCSHDGVSYIASPGSLCERHIVKTIKQMDFTDGKHVKLAFPEGFIKYRRMRQMYKYWENGILVVKVNGEGEQTVIPCSIKKTSKGFTLAYFDKMITSRGVFEPDKKIFINGDCHSNIHDCNVLDIQEQVVNDYGPDTYINLGDTHNCASLNHHDMDKGIPVKVDYMDEGAQTYYILKKMAEWAPETHIIFGNHERFARDFVAKVPQLATYLDFPFQCDIASLGYKLTELKQPLKMGPSTFVHGDVIMFGQPGRKTEKASRTFGREVMMGHVHKQEIRFGCYTLGLTGQLDQGYNEPSASDWVHGFGLCNQYKGHSFMTTIAIVDNVCVLDKVYRPISPEDWKLGEYTARMTYDIK